MSNPLPPVPDDFELGPRWRAWFRQLYVYLTSTSTGGGGLVPNTRTISTTAPLAGGGDLQADRTISITFGATDKVLGRFSSGGGNAEEIDCTAAGRALIDDADAAAQQRTLKLSRAKLDFVYG